MTTPTFRGDRWTSAGALPNELVLLAASFNAASLQLQTADNAAMEAAPTAAIVNVLDQMRQAGTYGLFISLSSVGEPGPGGGIMTISTATPLTVSIINPAGPNVEIDVGDQGGGIVPPAGDIQGTPLSPLVAGLQGVPILAGTPNAGQALIFDGTNWTPTNLPASGVQLAGDIAGGTTSIPKVTGLRGRAISNTAPSTGQILAWTGTQWAPTTPAASSGGTVNNITTTTPSTVSITNPTGPSVSIAVTAGGGGGDPGALTSTKIPIGFGPSPNYAAGVGTGYTPTTGDVLYAADLVITAAYAGGKPAYLDFGTLTGGTFKGFLADLGLPPIPLSFADADLPNNAGWLVSQTPTGPGVFGSQSASLAGALMTAGFSPGTLLPILRSLFYADAENELFVVISQDGTATNPATAAVLVANNAISPPSGGSPFLVNASNNQFIWTPQGVPGGGLTTPILFTVANLSPGYTSPTALVNAINAATSSSGTFSPNFATASYPTTGPNAGLFVITAPAGGSGEQASFSSGPSGADIAVGLGFTGPGFLTGGAGGDPGCSSGSAILILATATPQSV